MPSDDHRRLGVAVHAIRVVLDALKWLNASSGTESFRSRVEQPDVKRRIVVEQHSSATLGLQMSNASETVWSHTGNEGVQVNLGVLWLRTGDNTSVAEQRADLRYDVRPGEARLVLAQLAPETAAGKPLAPGEYDVSMGRLRSRSRGSFSVAMNH